jgi:hypothetical protein
MVKCFEFPRQKRNFTERKAASMRKKVQYQGWVEMAKPPQAETYAADIHGAPIDVLKAKKSGPVPRAVSGTAPKKNKVAKTKYRGVYVRPKRGSDSQGKLMVVDPQNKPRFAQG